MLTGCDVLKNFMSRDLEEEDFIIGQLYVDEVVKETPVISKPRSQIQNQSRTNPIGLEYSPSDNQALYQAINSWLGVPYQYGGTTVTVSTAPLLSAPSTDRCTA